MKVAHSAICTPGRCGLYETARELVAAERALGIDARLVDPLPHDKHGVSGEDRGVPIAGMPWAARADVIVNHSGIDNTPLQHTDQPVIHVAHGRPLSTFLGERAGGAPGFTWQTQRASNPRYRAVVTFWREYAPYLRNIWGSVPVHIVNAPCDLDYWRPGPSDYDFHGRKAAVNVVMLDPWSREDYTPYHSIQAFALFHKIRPDSRLHMFAWDGNKKALGGLSSLLGDGGGIIQAWAKDVRQILRASDILLTPHRIYTRSIREAMACGVQVVSGRDAHPEDIQRVALAMLDRLEKPRPAREIAAGLFDAEVAGASMVGLLERVCGLVGAS